MAKGKKVKKREARRRQETERREERCEDTEGKGNNVPDAHQENVTVLFKNDELHQLRTVVQKKDLSDVPQLIGAVILGKFDIVKRLLKEGCSIDLCGPDNFTPLMWAVKTKNLEMIDLLLARGADVILQDENGDNAVLMALQMDEWDQDSFLDFWNSLKGNDKFDPNCANKVGYTVLHYAARRQWDSLVESATEQGVDVNCVTSKGITPLMLAGSISHTTMVQALLRAHADISREDEKGCTALCYAISFMIHKRLETPNTSLQRLIDAVNAEDSELTMEGYLKRRLDLLVKPPVSAKDHSNTISTIIRSVMTFFMKYIQAGLEILLELKVFVRVKEAAEKHLDDVDYLHALLAVIFELLRYCDCCVGGGSTQVQEEELMEAFVRSGGADSCLRILSRHGLSSSTSWIMAAALMPLFVACPVGNCARGWLQLHYHEIHIYYRRFLEMCIVTYNFNADDYHIRLVKAKVKQFRELMKLLESGQTIVTQEKQIKKNVESGGEFKKESQISNGGAEIERIVPASMSFPVSKRMRRKAKANKLKVAKMRAQMIAELHVRVEKPVPKPSEGKSKSEKPSEKIEAVELPTIVEETDSQTLLDRNETSFSESYRSDSNQTTSDSSEVGEWPQSSPWDLIKSISTVEELKASLSKSATQSGKEPESPYLECQKPDNGVDRNTSETSGAGDGVSSFEGFELKPCKSLTLLSSNGYDGDCSSPKRSFSEEAISVYSSGPSSIQTRRSVTKRSQFSSSGTSHRSVDDLDSTVRDGSSVRFTRTNRNEADAILLYLQKMFQDLMTRYKKARKEEHALRLQSHLHMMSKNRNRGGEGDNAHYTRFQKKLQMVLQDLEEQYNRRVREKWESLMVKLRIAREHNIDERCYRRVVVNLRERLLKQQVRLDDMTDALAREREKDRATAKRREGSGSADYMVSREEYSKHESTDLTDTDITSGELNFEADCSASPRSSEQTSKTTPELMTPDMYLSDLSLRYNQETKSDGYSRYSYSSLSQVQIQEPSEMTFHLERYSDSSMLYFDSSNQKKMSLKCTSASTSKNQYQTSTSPVSFPGTSTQLSSSNQYAYPAPNYKQDAKKSSETSSPPITECTNSGRGQHSTNFSYPTMEGIGMYNSSQPNRHVPVPPGFSPQSVPSTSNQYVVNQANWQMNTTGAPVVMYSNFPTLYTQNTQGKLSSLQNSMVTASQKTGVQNPPKMEHGRWWWLLSALKNLPAKQKRVLEGLTLSKISGHFVIDKGTFGEVFLALDGAGKGIAVKNVPRYSFAGLTYVSLKKCVEPLLPLRHDNILHYLTCIEEDDHIYLITPLCEWNLGEYLMYLKLTNSLEPRTMDLVRQFLEGLRFLHTRGKPIIHGNLKPSNVLIDENGSLRLSDFGLYQTLQQHHRPLASSMIWWSRETFEDYNKSWRLICTLKSDIQVGGMLVHFVLSGGLHPFGSGANDILENLGRGVASIKITDVNASDVIAWMLHHDPYERPTITEVFRHIFFWPTSKRWKLVLACCGLMENPVPFPLEAFLSFLEAKAAQDRLAGDWVSVVKLKFNNLTAKEIERNNSLTGLLSFIRRQVREETASKAHLERIESSLQEYFLRVFPALPLTLYRMLALSDWFSHPVFQDFQQAK